MERHRKQFLFYEMKTKSDFRKNVLKIVSSIPEGKVTNYGTVATLAGSPNSSRVVGGILRTLTLDEDRIPWWRVINKSGRISINHNLGGSEKLIQKQKLENEGVMVSIKYTVDMRKYRWILY